MSAQSAPLLLPSWARAWDPAVGRGWRENDTRICPPAPASSSRLHGGAGRREDAKVREKVGNSRSQD